MCSGFHNTMLHNPKQVNVANVMTSVVVDPDNFISKLNVSDQSEVDVVPNRCYLPIVQSNLKNDRNEILAKTVLDSGSELLIICTKFFNRLQLKGISTNISIVCAGGNVTHNRAKTCEVVEFDFFGHGLQNACLVLDETCG